MPDSLRARGFGIARQGERAEGRCVRGGARGRDGGWIEQRVVDQANVADPGGDRQQGLARERIEGMLVQLMCEDKVWGDASIESESK